LPFAHRTRTGFNLIVINHCCHAKLQKAYGLLGSQ
jgi:hypothetical protein